jgi:hypothetical protein
VAFCLRRVESEQHWISTVPRRSRRSGCIRGRHRCHARLRAARGDGGAPIQCRGGAVDGQPRARCLGIRDRREPGGGARRRRELRTGGGAVWRRAAARAKGEPGEVSTALRLLTRLRCRGVDPPPADRPRPRFRRRVAGRRALDQRGSGARDRRFDRLRIGHGACSIGQTRGQKTARAEGTRHRTRAGEGAEPQSPARVRETVP